MIVQDQRKLPEQRIVGARIRNLEPMESLDLTIDPGFNVLYGLNGVGKSRLLHALSLDVDRTHGAVIELHLSAPPGPIDPTLVESWLERIPGNPWGMLVVAGESERFPGVSPQGPVTHLMLPVFEAARASLDLRPSPLPRHLEAAVFRLLERAAQTPQHLPALLRTETLRRFLDAAIEIAAEGRFIITLEDGLLRLELAAARPARHTVLGGLIEEARRSVLERAGVLDELGLYDSLHHELMTGLGDDESDADLDQDFIDFALVTMLEQAWEESALETCFHPLLAAGNPLLPERLGLTDLPAWHAAPVLEIGTADRHGGPASISILADWRTHDLEMLQQATFSQLPPLLLRIGGQLPPDRDIGIISSSDERTVFETNVDHTWAVEDIEGLANSILGLLMEDAPRLEIVQRSPAGESRFFMWGLLDWTAVEADERRIHVSSLSDARRRWAQLAIGLALRLRGGAREHARLVVIDEPERGLHRVAERRLADGLAELSRSLGLTFVVATHSPAFLRIHGSAQHHLVRDERGRLAVQQLDVEHAQTDVLGLSMADRAQFLQAVVYVVDASDAAVLTGFLGASLGHHGIQVRVLPRLARTDSLTIRDLIAPADDPAAHALHQVLRLTDARIIVAADSTQLTGLPEDADRTVWERSPQAQAYHLIGDLMTLLETIGALPRAEIASFDREELRACLASSATDPDSIQLAASRSDRMPEVIPHLLDLAAGRRPEWDAVWDPYHDWLPVDDVPF